MKSNPDFHLLAKSLTACAALLAGLAQAAPPIWLPPAELPTGTVLLQVEELKGYYLHCDQLSSTAFLDSSTAAHCSVAAERLRRLGFDGRGNAVLAWWKVMSEERRAPVPVLRSTPPKGVASL